MEEVPPGHSQGGVARGRASPPNRFHRHQHDLLTGSRRPFLQPQKHVRAIHPGRQVRPHLDEALLLSVLLQPGTPRPVRASVQPRQLHEKVRAPD